MIKKWLNKLFGIGGYEEYAQTLHKRSLSEIKQTADRIHEMNKILVRKTTAYKVYMATGGVKKV